MDLDDQIVTRRDRPTRTDLIWIDTSDFHAWIYSKPADAVFYASLLGEILFDDRKLLSRKMNFDLSFALSDNLDTRLTNAKGRGVEDISLRRRKIVDLPRDAAETHQIKGRRPGCLSLEHPLDSSHKDVGRVSFVKIKVELEGDQKIQGVIEVTADTIFIDTAIENSARGILRSLGILVTYEN